MRDSLQRKWLLYTAIAIPLCLLLIGGVYLLQRNATEVQSGQPHGDTTGPIEQPLPVLTDRQGCTMETYPSFDLNDWKTVAANSGFIAEISITKNRGSGEPAPYKSTVFDASVSKNIKGQLPPSVSFAQLGTAECEAQGRPLLREGRRYLAALNSNTDVPVMSLVSSVELSTADADALERGAPVSPSIETILRSISG